MTERAGKARAPKSVHWWISVAFIGFGLMMVVALVLQNYSSQGLIEHRYWIDVLRAASSERAALVRAGRADLLPTSGPIRSWYVAPGRDSDIPEHLQNLAPGLYSTETGFWTFSWSEDLRGRESSHVLVAELPPGRLITLVDVEPLDSRQDRDALLSVAWALVLVLYIGGVILWLQANLVIPVRDLAQRMQRIQPGDQQARLPTTYRREEIRIIANASNAHLERVEQFIAREKSLLDQASHEFRTPIAVISGAVDVLKQIGLPASSTPALSRIEHAVDDLSQTMVALLYLARESSRDDAPSDVTLLHDLLPRLVADHEHLLRDKQARLTLAPPEITVIEAPEAMVRIAVSNLLRNALENTASGEVRVTLAEGVISVIDSGQGFDPVEAARRYRENLRSASPARGQGLGLYLVGRVCERFGWHLSIRAVATGGTHAALDLSSSVVALDD